MKKKLTARQRNKWRKFEKKRVKLIMYINHLIEDYSPENDALIRKLLNAYRLKVPMGIGSQGFVERLAKFWHMKLRYHMDQIWSVIKERKIHANQLEFKQNYRESLIGEVENMLIRSNEIGQLIDFAKTELNNLDCYPNAERFLNEHDIRHELEALNSYLKNPPGDGEALLVSTKLENKVWSYESRVIGLAEQLERIDIIRPLKELAEDDYAGQQLRSVGITNAWPVGIIMIEGWRLSVLESEEGIFFIHLEKMLAKMGGCPLGLVYDSRQWRNGEGYNMPEKSCHHCWKKQFCPGNQYLEALSLGELVIKLRLAWKNRNDILRVIPEFEVKLLGAKKD